MRKEETSDKFSSTTYFNCVCKMHSEFLSKSFSILYIRKTLTEIAFTRRHGYLLCIENQIVFFNIVKAAACPPNFVFAYSADVV